MPLIKSGSQKAIGTNIKVEMAHGKKKKQAVAIALDTARSSGAKIVGGLIRQKRMKKL